MKVAVGSFRGEARERNFCQARADISRFIQMRAAADGARGGGGVLRGWNEEAGSLRERRGGEHAAVNEERSEAASGSLRLLFLGKSSLVCDLAEKGRMNR